MGYRSNLIVLKKNVMLAAALDELIDTDYAGIYPKSDGFWYGRAAGIETKLFQDLTVQDRDAITQLTSIDTLELPRRGVRSGGADIAKLTVIPNPSRRKVVWINSEGTAFIGAGITGSTVTGTPTNANDADTTWVNLASAALANVAAGIASAIFTLWRGDQDPLMQAVIMNPSASLAASRMQAGFFSAAPSASSDTINPTLSAFWRCSSLAGDITWKFVTSDASGMGVTDSGITVALNTPYTLVVKYNGGVPVGAISTDYGATYVVDNVPAASNVPAGTTGLGYVIRNQTTTVTAKNLRISRVYFEGN